MTSEKFFRIAYIVAFILALCLFVSPFVIPIFFAATIALALFPIQLIMEKKGLKRGTAAGLLTFLFSSIFSIPFLFFITKGAIAVTEQLQKFSESEKYKNHDMQNILLTLRHDVVEKIQYLASKYEFAQFLNDEKIDTYFQAINAYLLKFFQGLAKGLPFAVLFLVVMIFCTFSFLRNADGIKKTFQNIFGFSDPVMDELASIFVRDARQVYISNIGTGLIQSLIVATSVGLVGLGDFFLVFFVTLILSFIPIVGAAPVAFLFAAYGYLRGEPGHALTLAIVGSFAGVVDNFLRPYLASLGESRMPTVVSFICVLGGVILLGLPGLFVGILVGAITYDTLPLFWKELKGK